VIHCAAETAGKWEEHQRNSLDATERMVRAAAAAGIERFLHVSSLAVLAGAAGRPIGDEHPLEPDSRGSGPYVWGKLESERLAVQIGAELGVAVKVVRPGALVDYKDFDPPGRLGKRLGNIFVAVGSPRHRLGTTEVHFGANLMAWMADHWAETPALLNLLDPELPTKRDLLNRLKQNNPDLSVVWLPTVALVPLSWFATLLQKVLKPGRPAINVAKVFSVQSYDTAGVGRLASAMTAPELQRDARLTPTRA
jgi:nucleoside-diphosphate-sugar epimerase